MEELLKQLVDGQKVIIEEIQGLKLGQNRLEEEVSTIKLDISVLKTDVSELKTDVSIIQEEMGTKAQQRENTDIIRALLHNQEEFSAKLEELSLNTVSKAVMEKFATKEDISKLATKEDVSSLDVKFEVLNSRLFNQEIEVARLKAVK